MKKTKNYFQLCKQLNEKGYDKTIVGFYIAEAIIKNMEQHINSYMSRQKKDFGNKENNKIFNTLESVIKNSPKDKITEEDVEKLEHAYRILLEKTTTRVYEVNFMYDVLNFYLSNARLPYPQAFEKLSEQLITLKNADWQPRGMAPYQLEKGDILTREYLALVNRSRRNVERNFGVVFQN